MHIIPPLYNYGFPRFGFENTSTQRCCYGETTFVGLQYATPVQTLAGKFWHGNRLESRYNE